MGKIGKLFSRLKDGWQGLSRIKKISCVLVLLSVLFVSGTVYYLNTRVQYGVLFTDLSEGDAGTIADELKQENVSYKLADNGTTIMVDKTKVDQVRIELAEDDKLPDSSQGFELFDSSNVMTTDADRKITYQRALTGELEKAIDSLNEVEKSKVMLVTTKESVFDDDDSNSNSSKAAKASIVLTLKSSGITTEAVQGIVALTAGAVENLSQRNIKVVDSNGNVLFNGNKGTSNLVSSNNKYLTITQNYEKSLQKKIHSLLDPIYGKKKVEVSVNLSLDFDSVKNKTVTYSNPQIRSEKTASEVNGAATSSTQTGEANNSATNASSSSNNGSTESSSRTVNNELNTSTTNTIKAPGSISQMTASVVIDSDISKSDRKKIKSLVSSAIGYNKGRGDSLQVQSVNFAKHSKKTHHTVKKQKKSSNWNIWAYIGLGVAALVLIGTIVFLIMRFRRRRLEEEYEDYEDETTPTADVTADTATKYPEEQKTEKEDKKPLVKPAKPSKEQELNKRTRDYAKENPEEVADLLKAWMKEDNKG
ncbi:MAG: flagellar basal-body MS-ring/collar protein FliF [Liquorilactobacillus nagelii]|uniref:flagellar basal-body MS-ring/collar protein FliF n=1 Tax=Liquorilactobacillus nagelii TaxID=82688 RepID=UPI0039EBF69B